MLHGGVYTPRCGRRFRGESPPVRPVSMDGAFHHEDKHRLNSLHNHPHNYPHNCEAQEITA